MTGPSINQMSQSSSSSQLVLKLHSAATSLITSYYVYIMFMTSGSPESYCSTEPAFVFAFTLHFYVVRAN
jgi:hypothetical protein